MNKLLIPSMLASVLALVACTAPVGDGAPPPSEDAGADPNSFLQPGGNSYSATSSGQVVVIETVHNYDLGGTVSSTGECMVDSPTLHGKGQISFVDDGTIFADPYWPSLHVGTWKQTGDVDELCMFGKCQTCSVAVHGSQCGLSCPDGITMPETYEYDELIPFTFSCTNGTCTTLGGAHVNANGTVTYNDFVLATWTGTHVEAQICFNQNCGLFHPTK